MGSVERRKRKKMKNDVCWCVWVVTGVLVCVGW